MTTDTEHLYKRSEIIQDICDPDIVSEETPLITLDNKTAIYMSNIGKDTK